MYFCYPFQLLYSYCISSTSRGGGGFGDFRLWDEIGLPPSFPCIIIGILSLAEEHLSFASLPFYVPVESCKCNGILWNRDVQFDFLVDIKRGDATAAATHSCCVSYCFDEKRETEPGRQRGFMVFIYMYTHTQARVSCMISQREDEKVLFFRERRWWWDDLMGPAKEKKRR